MSTRNASFTFLFLSKFLKARVRPEGPDGRCGRLVDVGVQKTAPFPKVVSLEIHIPGSPVRAIPWSAVVSVTENEIVTRASNGHHAAADLWLRRDVLDDQVIDVRGARVRRVNDLQFIYAEGQLIVVHVEVGVLGILNRLGFEKTVSALLRWLFDYNIKESVISWRNVEFVGPEGVPGAVRVSAQPSQLDDIHPAELADILEELGLEERRTLFKRLDIETAAEALEEVDPDIQRTLMTQEDPGKAADILEEMPAPEAAEVLRELHHADAQTIISRMETEAADDVRALLAHEEESAGSLINPSCFEVRPNDAAGPILARIRATAKDVRCLNPIYVLDGDRRLIGVVALRELLSAPEDATLDGLMTTHVIKVTPQTSIKEVARLFTKYGVRAIPVEHETVGFLGTIRFKDVVNDLAHLLKESG